MPRWAATSSTLCPEARSISAQPCHSTAVPAISSRAPRPRGQGGAGELRIDAEDLGERRVVDPGRATRGDRGGPPSRRRSGSAGLGGVALDGGLSGVALGGVALGGGLGGGCHAGLGGGLGGGCHAGLSGGRGGVDSAIPFTGLTLSRVRRARAMASSWGQMPWKT
jgi:hypothetical protein